MGPFPPNHSSGRLDRRTRRYRSIAFTDLAPMGRTRTREPLPTTVRVMSSRSTSSRRSPATSESLAPVSMNAPRKAVSRLETKCGPHKP
jgi:hypothetical protein